jgi:hypothetical protein
MALTKVVALRIVNPLAAAAAAVQVVTAVLFTFFAYAIPFALVRQVHFFSGYALAVLILVHLILNWSWVKSTYLRKRSKA